MKNTISEETSAEGRLDYLLVYFQYYSKVQDYHILQHFRYTAFYTYDVLKKED